MGILMTERDFDRRLQLLEEHNKKLKEDIHDLQAGLAASSRDFSILNRITKERQNEMVMLNAMIGQLQSDIAEIVALCEKAWGVTNKPKSIIISPN